MINPTFPQTPQIKQYHATFTQTGTSNPIVTVLHNTLGGNITWTRNALGEYLGTGNELFTANKTFWICGGEIVQPSTHLIGSSAFLAFKITRINNDTIAIKSYTGVNTSILKEWSDVGGTLHFIIYVYN